MCGNNFVPKLSRREGNVIGVHPTCTRSAPHYHPNEQRGDPQNPGPRQGHLEGERAMLIHFFPEAEGQVGGGGTDSDNPDVQMQNWPLIIWSHLRTPPMPIACSWISLSTQPLDHLHNLNPSARPAPPVGSTTKAARNKHWDVNYKQGQPPLFITKAWTFAIQEIPIAGSTLHTEIYRTVI